MNPALGWLTCPHCEAKATVHQEQRGVRRALYYRCGDPVSGEGCGTVQIRGASGQVWIREHMRPLDIDARENVREEAGAEAAESARAVAVKLAASERKKSGFLESLGEFWGVSGGS